MNSYALIDSDDQIAEVISALDGHDEVGLDAERASGFKYGQDAYLVQLIVDQKAFLVDPVGLSQASVNELASQLNSKEWILHSATQDLPCLSALGMYPKTLFDTEVAAKLLGFEKFGLAAIIQEIEGVELKKEHSAADWSVRPLTEEMLEYAAQDVYFLFSLKAELWKRLDELGRTQFAKEEFEHLLNFRPKDPGPNPWRRVSGIHALTKPLQLARLREMWLIRDAFARDKDIAPGRVVSDRSLSHAASKEYKSLTEMKSDKQFHGRLLPKLYNQLFDAYSTAHTKEMPPLRETNGDSIPHHKNWQKLKPEVDARYKKLKELLLAAHEETGIPIESMMSPALIREALWKETEPEYLEDFFRAKGAREWQLGLVLPLIRDLF